MRELVITCLLGAVLWIVASCAVSLISEARMYLERKRMKVVDIETVKLKGGEFDGQTLKVQVGIAAVMVPMPGRVKPLQVAINEAMRGDRRMQYVEYGRTGETEDGLRVYRCTKDWHFANN